MNVQILERKFSMRAEYDITARGHLLEILDDVVGQTKKLSRR